MGATIRRASTTLARTESCREVRHEQAVPGAQFFEDLIEVARRADGPSHDLEPEAGGARERFDVRRAGRRVRRVVDGPHTTQAWSKGFQRFEPLRHELGRETRDPGEVSFRVRERLHDARRDGIADEREHDWNRPCRRSCRERGRFTAREDHADARLDQGVGRGGQALAIPIGERDVEGHVATFLEAKTPEAGLEPLGRRVIGGPRIVQHTDEVWRTLALGQRRGWEQPDQREDRRSEDDPAAPTHAATA
jgi:hypothetical protein